MSKILAIETSFDETGAAVLSDRRVIANVLASSVDLHKEWGGVVPSIARQAHLDNIDLVCKEALRKSRSSLGEIDYIAVTHGPGLAIALEVGLQYAQNLAYKNEKPLIPVNHMEGHFLSPFAQNSAGGGSDYDDLQVRELFPI